MKIKGKVIDKKWFENYWFYYRVHTIVGIFVILISIYTIVECANKVDPDVTVTYIGSSYFDENFASSFEEKLSPLIVDADGDGIKKIFFSALTIGGEIRSEQDIAMQQKAQLEIAVGDTYLYLMDRQNFEMYQEQGVFENISQYLNETEPVYGVPAHKSAFLKELGIPNGSDIYVSVRVLTQGDEKKPKKVIQQNNAFLILEELYKKY